jgi:murein DD-endopeptidase MepM/ murein hydrolase activator NlpD
MATLPVSRVYLLVLIGSLVGVSALALLCMLDSPTVQASAGLPIHPQQAAPFLSVPYYDAYWLTAYVDHDPLGAAYGAYNDSIETFNGSTAVRANGVCGTDSAGRPIAYYTQPMSQGLCLWYDSHDGLDFGLVYEPILAAADGTVVRAGWQSWTNRRTGYGLHLRILHAGGYETRYAHLSALAVFTNTQVHRGQIVATSGNTGNVFGAPQGGHHLHFEVRLNNIATDPFGGTGAQWLWRDGTWDALGRWTGQSPPDYGTT